MKLLLKGQSRHRWHPRRSVKYYQKRLLSFWEFKRVEWSKFMFYERQFWCIYFAYTRRVPTVRNQRTGTFLSTCVTSWKKELDIVQGPRPHYVTYSTGVSMTYTAPRGVVVIHWDHETPSPLPYLCIRHSWRAAAVGGLAGACRSVLFLGKVPALYQDIKDSPGVLNFNGCNCKVLWKEWLIIVQFHY